MAQPSAYKKTWGQSPNKIKKSVWSQLWGDEDSRCLANQSSSLGKFWSVRERSQKSKVDCTWGIEVIASGLPMHAHLYTHVCARTHTYSCTHKPRETGRVGFSTTRYVGIRRKAQVPAPTKAIHITVSLDQEALWVFTLSTSEVHEGWWDASAKSVGLQTWQLEIPL